MSDVFLSIEVCLYESSTSNIGSLVVSLSNGNLCLLTPTEGSSLGLTQTWHAHDFEPWIAAWNHWDTNVIYSGLTLNSYLEFSFLKCLCYLGGDDLRLKVWDIRQGFTHPTFVNKRYTFMAFDRLTCPDSWIEIRSWCHLHPKPSACRTHPCRRKVCGIVCFPMVLES